MRPIHPGGLLPICGARPSPQECNLLTEEAPGIRLCFNTSPENTVEALRRWIQA
ncbi:hypothetical protein ACIRPU_10100 [Streptomyces sp. NPDC102259]|uniref:hypothetical protein n=1 Tax=Streptomyces sp. NPDC102259 TaxID=3366148 RepID=UPI00380A2923